MGKDQQTFYDGDYEVNHVNYGGGYGGDDLVCQVKKHGREVAHCTWHPNSGTPNVHGDCPLRGGRHCLR